MARSKTQYGYMATFQVLVPVDPADFESTSQRAQAVNAVSEGDDASSLLKLEGARVVRTSRPVRYGVLPKAGEAAAADEGQTDIEDAIKQAGEGGEGGEGGGEPELPIGEQQSQDTHDAATGGRRGKRAA